MGNSERTNRFRPIVNFYLIYTYLKICFITLNYDHKELGILI